ncbi:hypothetical protein K466DRAFT_386107 [Polyporus arcularius HHB13444]|uniref:Uncharacterized protein n=1 Tax=Polyporus arcularius HHB13444 TaxID=1314778 RepID=A0A5C3PKY7_9APHY|nr:hypothetical protein K466DRAFT_386107 [Polyporus arcularius HHB13444]
MAAPRRQEEVARGQVDRRKYTRNINPSPSRLPVSSVEQTDADLCCKHIGRERSSGCKYEDGFCVAYSDPQERVPQTIYKPLTCAPASDESLMSPRSEVNTDPG